MLVAIPLSSVIVGMVMLWLAVHNEDGLVVDDYYKRGMEINRTLERDAAAAEFGLSSNVRFIEENAQVVASLEGNRGFVYPDRVTLGIYHSVRPGHDSEIELARISDKFYAGPVPDLVPGKWYASLYDEGWRLTGRIDWPTESASLQPSKE